MNARAPDEFSYRERKDGEVAVLRDGRVVATLRGHAASAFLGSMASRSGLAAQALMARVTGNYKRGNERRAGRHARNR